MSRIQRTKSELRALPVDAFISPAEAARLYGQHRQRIVHAIDQGYVSSTVVGPYRLVTKEAVAVYLLHPPSVGWKKGRPRSRPLLTAL